MTVESLLTDYKQSDDPILMLRALLADYRSIGDIIDEKEFTLLNFLTHIHYLSLHELTRYIKVTTKEDFQSIYRFILDSGYVVGKSETEYFLFVGLISTAIKYSLVEEMKEIIGELKITIKRRERMRFNCICSDDLVDSITDEQSEEMISYLSELGVTKTTANSHTVMINGKIERRQFNTDENSHIEKKSVVTVEQLLRERRYSEIDKNNKEEIYEASIAVDDTILVDSPQSFHDYIVENELFYISGNVINYLISSGVTDINKIILWAEMSGESHELLLVMRRVDTLYNGDWY